MFKIVHTVYLNSTKERRSEFEYHSTEKTFSEPLKQQLLQDIKHQHPVIVLDAQAQLPPFWQTRLLQPMVENDAIEHISALSFNQHELSPLTGDFAGNLTQLDQTTYLIQTPQYFISKVFNPKCFAVRNVTALSNHATYYAVNNLLVDVPPTDRQQIKAVALPDTGDQRPLPAHPLAELQLKLQNIELNEIPAGYPKLDQKSVALHIVMDWGGGVHQWVNDFIQSHHNMHHLVLSSQGEFFRQQQGERFQLHWQNTTGIVIDEFHLSTPIKATTAHHAAYQAMLSDIIKRWQIDQMMVSSLIGHAMDCLNTGLPTLRILHDYFPHWPSLNARFDVEATDQENINQALKDTYTEPFGAITADELSSWQQANNELLSQNNISIVAPDESVKTNLLKLPHSTVYNKTQIIPHALAPLEAVEYQAENMPFKILILGRISPPKGQELLQQCIELLAEDRSIQFVLLGAGINGKDFEKYPNSRVIVDYKQTELSQHLSEVSPQLALMTSVTAETFSYTLSELQMSGVPVLATAVGALKNRINSGENGILVKPHAEAIVEQIMLLQKQPEKLKKLRQGALQTTHNSIDQNSHDFTELLVSNDRNNDTNSQAYKTLGLLKPSPLAQTLQTSLKHSADLSTSLQATELDLAEKTNWAKQLNEQNQHLTDNIELGRKEIKHLTDTIDAQSKAHNSEIKSLQNEVFQISHQLNKVDKELIETIQLRDQLSQQLHDSDNSLNQAQNTIKGMLNSRSWRVTEPLRTFTTYARHKRNAIKFRLAQLKSLPKRVTNSLKTRGLKQTASMAKNKLKKPKQPVKTAAQQISQDYKPLTLRKHKTPLVSIVIPVYNQFKHTYHCLESLVRLTDNTSFEVIVVDDCSTDETAQAIKNISGITYHRQIENGGFIESCNTGARIAKGEFLLFLNNDTEVLKGWLDELVMTFEQHADAGLVGSQLLYPDGRLQEAGGIVFSDASGWNYGRLDAPEAPEYQHLREATYISGASILVKSTLFEQLGYFDERYKPAYYEDTDLAFAVRKVGLKVYYQPLSRVIHFEGISSGTDLNAGTKKYQVVNQEKFAAKWQSELKHQPKPGSDIELARFQNQPPRVLIFDACTPTPDQDSGSLRMINLMKIFRQLGYQVSFVPENMAHFESYTEDLQRLGVECIYAPKYASPVEYLKAKGAYFQTVILSRYYVAEPLMPMIRAYCPKAQIWFDTVDLHYLRELRMAEMAVDNQVDAAAIKSAMQTKNKELNVAKNCDLTLVVSPYEQQVLAEETPDLNVAVLSNIHEIFGGHTGFNGSKDLLFIGGYQHTPNVDGVLWLVNDILPKIVKQIPDIKLHIVGSKAPQQVIDLGQNPNVEFHGFVEDIEPLMQNIRIAVAPLRFGAGVKGKVNMSMSYGQPVVGTKVAVEGMYTQHKHDVMMADDASEFAAAVIRLYQDPTLWQQISQGGLKNVERWFSFNAAQDKMAELLKKS